MDIEAILKEYNSMMKKQTSLQSMKTFKNEKLLSNSKSPDAKTRRDKLALRKQHSVYMMEPTKQKKQENLVEEEEKVTGKVTLTDYKNYFSYSLGICGVLLYLAVCIAASISQLSVTYFLTYWAN